MGLRCPCSSSTLVSLGALASTVADGVGATAVTLWVGATDNLASVATWPPWSDQAGHLAAPHAGPHPPGRHHTCDLDRRRPARSQARRGTARSCPRNWRSCARWPAAAPTAPSAPNCTSAGRPSKRTCGAAMAAWAWTGGLAAVLTMLLVFALCSPWPSSRGRRPTRASRAPLVSYASRGRPSSCRPSGKLTFAEMRHVGGG